MFVQLRKDYLGQKAGQRIDVDEPVAQALLQQNVAEPIQDDVLGQTIARSVEGLLGGLTKTLNDTVDATLKEFAAAQAKSRRNAVPALFGPGGEGDPKGRSFGDWLLAVRRGDARTLVEKYHTELPEPGQKAALTSAAGAQGGYLVPAEFIPDLLSVTVEESVVRKKATVIPLSSRSVQIPALDLRTDPAADDTQFFGGLVATWTEEAATETEKEPQFKQIELVAWELAGYSLVSNALLADSAVGLEMLLRKLFGGAIAWYEDLAFLRGSGVGKPLGMTEAGCAISVSRNTASDFKLVDAAKMIARLLPGWTPRTTCWVMSPSVMEKVIQIADAASRAIWIPSARDELPMTLFGIPIAVSEKLKQLGTAKDVLLADMRHYLIGDRQQIEVAYSDHFRFTNNQGTWRFVSRVGGQPWLAAAVNLAGQTDTVSPFVYLS